MDRSWRLRRLSVSLRVACTCLIVVLGGGYVASVKQLYDHYENKDERPGLSMDDIVGSFHGVSSPAPLITALDGRMRQYVTDSEHALLMTWLRGDRISEDYDNIDLGDEAPAEILARDCLRCHSRKATEGEGIGARVPLDYWDDVKKEAFTKQLDPVSVAILTTSTHTHALSMAAVTVITSLLFLATAWPRRLRHGIVLLTFVALVADLASWWLARAYAPFSYVIVSAGAVYGALLGLQLVGALLDMWLGPRPREEAV